MLWQSISLRAKKWLPLRVCVHICIRLCVMCSRRKSAGERIKRREVKLPSVACARPVQICVTGTNRRLIIRHEYFIVHQLVNMRAGVKVLVSFHHDSYISITYKFLIFLKNPSQYIQFEKYFLCDFGIMEILFLIESIICKWRSLDGGAHTLDGAGSDSTAIT